MILINRFKKFLGAQQYGAEKEAPEAYDIWAGGYDCQPGNLMLYLDEEIFSGLLAITEVKGKTIIDVGCGTGRHWPQLLDQGPAELVGYDVSGGMLSQLKKKFPFADTRLATDNRLQDIKDATIDLVISTLTLAHIRNMEEAFEAWSRILRPGGELILTDYHPSLLGAGGKRDFTSGGRKVVIRNHVHPVHKVRQAAGKYHLHILSFKEKFVDESVRAFYVNQQALALYDRFRGLPLIYGMHMRRS